MKHTFFLRFTIVVIAGLVNHNILCKKFEEPNHSNHLLAPSSERKHREELFQKGESFLKTNLDSTWSYAQQLMNWGTKHSEFWRGKAYALLGSYYREKHDNDSVIYCSEMAISIFTKLDSTQACIQPMLHIGITYRRKGTHEKAIDQILKIIELSEKFQDIKGLVYGYSELSWIYRHLKDTIKPVFYMEKAYELSKQLSRIHQMKMNHNLALSYDRAKRYEEAIRLFKEQLTDFSEILSLYGTSVTYTNIARTYITIDEYDSAKKYLDMGTPLRSEINKPMHNAYAYKEYASLYLYTGNYHKAVEYAQKVYDIGQEFEDFGHIEDGARTLMEGYRGLKDYKNSDHYSMEYLKIREQLFNRDKQGIIEELEARHQTAMKEREIENLRAQKAINQKTIIILTGAIIFVAVVLFFLIMLLKTRLSKQKAEKELTATRLRLARQQLDHHKQQLDHFTSTVREKSQIIKQLEKQIHAQFSGQKGKYENLNELRQSIILTDSDWTHFKSIFENAYPQFFFRLKKQRPDLTQADLRLAALLKLDMTNKEISAMLGISPDSVTRSKHRIKKKLNIYEKNELEEYITAI